MGGAVGTVSRNAMGSRLKRTLSSEDNWANAREGRYSNPSSDLMGDRFELHDLGRIF